MGLCCCLNAVCQQNLLKIEKQLCSMVRGSKTDIAHTFLLQNEVQNLDIILAVACTLSTSMNHTFPEVIMAGKELQSRGHSLPMPKETEEPAAIALPTQQSPLPVSCGEHEGRSCSASSGFEMSNRIGTLHCFHK